jgi:2-amino-4-hydroxy-6-hydroxymethyldihydropteridine diphosphokinase
VTGARRVLLALGSNLGDRAGHLRGAVAALGDEVVATSAVYETPPVGGPEQGPYLNAVVALRTDRSARDLLHRAHELEAAAGRVRLERWGPRTLDVDVLWIDGEEVDEPDLVVPHPRMFERAFVLVPLADVAPDLVPADAPTDATIVSVGPLTREATGTVAASASRDEGGDA